MEDLDVSTVEDVNNSLRVKYKQQKILINNLLLIALFWALVFILAILLTSSTPLILDKIVFFGGLSFIPLILVLFIQITNIRKLNKHIRDLNLQKEIFTEQINEKEKTSNKLKTDLELQNKTKTS